MLRPLMFGPCGMMPVRSTRGFTLFAGLAIGLGSLAGCGNEAFVPPPSPELSAIPDASAVKKSTSVVMIFPQGKNDDRDTFAQAARQEAGKARISLTVDQVTAEGGPSSQAGLIRSAASRGASVLLVEPVDLPEVADALNAVRERGTPVLLLQENVTGKGSGPVKPFKRLAFVPFADPARELVKAAIQDTKRSALPADGHVLLLGDNRNGPLAQALATAIRTALSEAGIKSVTDLTLEGVTEKDKPEVLSKINADPKVTIVLASDAQSLATALSCLDAIKTNRALTVGGCQSIDKQVNVAAIMGTVGILDRNIPTFGRQALHLAVKLAKGESIPDLTEVPLPFISSTGALPNVPPTKEGTALPGDVPKKDREK